MGVTVLVTGAGGPAGVNVIRALAESSRVVAVDADPGAVGLRLADESAVIPRADHVDYADALEAVAIEFGATALVPTVAEELDALVQAAPRLTAAGLQSWLPDPEAARCCVDKWLFAECTDRAGMPVPATALGHRGEVPGPWIIKPRWGRGSRDVIAVDDPEEVDRLVRRVPDPIVQHRVSGREFTVDALVAPDGFAAGLVPRWRSETRGGISTKGVTFDHDGLLEQTGDLLAAVGLVGPANVQGFIEDDGTVGFIEINPRFSGGLPLSIAAGADLVGEYLRGVLGQPIRPERLQFRAGVTMLRYFEEVFEG
jgi:carbamoyl-phosphate synthase large subunit